MIENPSATRKQIKGRPLHSSRKSVGVVITRHDDDEVVFEGKEGTLLLSRAMPTPAPRMSRLEDRGIHFQVVEHFLSALFAAGIVRGLTVRLSGGSELPILDGSAIKWCDLLETSFRGLFGELRGRPPLVISQRYIHYRPINDLRDGTCVFIGPPLAPDTLTLVSVVPIDHLHASYEHTFHFAYDAESYERYRHEVAKFPTYVEQPLAVLREPGLYEGAIVGTNITQLPSDLPRKDAPARHKNLDLLGDAYANIFALRQRLVGTIVASRHGHRDTHEAFALMRQKISASRDVRDAVIHSLECCAARQDRKFTTATPYSEIMEILK